MQRDIDSLPYVSVQFFSFCSNVDCSETKYTSGNVLQLYIRKYFLCIQQPFSLLCFLSFKYQFLPHDCGITNDLIVYY